MGKYKSQWTGPQIDEGVGAARNPDTTPTADSDALITSDAVAKVQQGFAPIENDATASQAYAIGDLLVWGGILYKAKTVIAVNDSFTVGTNIEATTIADKLNNIDTEITSNTDTTLTGVLIGNGSKVGTKSLDTSSLTNDADHVPVSSVVKSALIFVPETGNAGFHNSIYRGKKLGTSVTAAQYAEISAGTFKDMFIGDYWEINSVIWRIAAFDYWLHDGDTECTTHHVVIVPDGILGSAKMNNSNTTAGGYVGSNIYTGANSNTGLSGAKTTINNAFGSAHILSHRELLTNAISGDKASGWAWYDSTVDLMNEVMVYGCHAWGSAPGFETGIDKSQLPLFALDPSKITNRSYWWLRDVASGASFAYVNSLGSAGDTYASSTFGVRPAFAIVA